MRHVFVVLLVWNLATNLGSGQVILNLPSQVEGYGAIPQELVFVHGNTSLLFPGEYFYYKVYCLDTSHGKLSHLSKIAYVEMVGPKGVSVFKHKIRLESGVGYGDFFVPTNVETAGYKLLAYTQWMRNEGQAQFFQSDVSIINPYLGDQDLVGEMVSHPVDSLDSPETLQIRSVPDTTEVYQDRPGPIGLTVSGKKFGKRSKVTLTFKNAAKDPTLKGNYSISVRKTNGLPAPKWTSFAGFVKQTAALPKQSAAILGDSIYLPELRGELFSGKVTNLNGNLPVEGLKVALSIPGDSYVFEVVQTDQDGYFHLNIDKSYAGERMFWQLLSDQANDYGVELLEPKSPDYSQLDLYRVRLDTSMREEIRRRSIHNQIENSYFGFRPDSVLSIPPARFLEKKEREIYVLDDYTRFKTVRETILEIINDVSSLRLGKDTYAIRVKGYDYANITNDLPLILMDGCFVGQHNALLDFDARKIASIGVLRHSFVFGPEVFQGALLIQTKSGSGYEGLIGDGEMGGKTIFKPRAQKKYFVQRYGGLEAGEADHLPDDRLQLLWMPALQLKGGETQVDFFTSDVPGEYAIQLEGLTEENQPVSIQTSIQVE